MTLPTLFIGSSSEGKAVAQKLQSLLQRKADVTIWDQGVFGIGTGTLETLVESSTKYDFAALVLTPDDLLESRGATHHAPRDNVLFELGLFMGAIGSRRTFVVASDSRDLKVPTDLAGITTTRYSSERPDGNLSAALGPCATEIEDRIAALGRRNPDAFAASLNHSEVRVVKGDLFGFAGKPNTILLPTNVYFDTTAGSAIVDSRSTLGIYVARTSAAGVLSKFDGAIDAELQSRSLQTDPHQGAFSKPGRQVAYLTGSTVHVETREENLLLFGLTGLHQSGTRFIASLSEEGLSSALKALWKHIAKSPVRGDLYMPVVGSGFGGITRRTALAHILLTYRAAEAKSETRPCSSLNVVVYHDDWKGGKWVRHLFEGLMGPM